MLITIKKIIDELNQSKVRYCHWKSNEHLSGGLDGIGDLDILVDSREIMIYEKIFRNNGVVKLISQFGSCYPYVEDWVGMDYNTGKMFHIHLHTRIVTGHLGMKEYELPMTELALDTRIKDVETNCYIVDPNLEIVMLYTRIGLKAKDLSLLKAVIGKYQCSNQYKKEADYLKPFVKWKNIEEIASLYYDTHNRAELLSLIKKEALSAHDYLLLNKITTHTFCHFRRYGSLMVGIRKLYYSLGISCRRLLRKRFDKNITIKKTFERGHFVVFVGQDGAGKSTITNEIEKWLMWKIDAKRFYLGSGDHYNPWQKHLLNLMPNKKNKLLQVISGLLTVSFLLAQSNYVLKTTKKSKEYVKKGGIALFDRFPQVMVHGINDGPKIRALMLPKIKNQKLRSFICKFANIEEERISKAATMQVDIVFKLLLTPEESMKRKPENSLDVLLKKHNIVKNMQINADYVVEIDANQDYQTEIIDIKQHIWKVLQKS